MSNVQVLLGGFHAEQRRGGPQPVAELQGAEPVERESAVHEAFRDTDQVKSEGTPEGGGSSGGGCTSPRSTPPVYCGLLLLFRSLFGSDLD